MDLLLKNNIIDKRNSLYHYLYIGTSAILISCGIVCQMALATTQSSNDKCFILLRT